MTEMMDFFKKQGAQGGKKRAEKLTADQLSAIGRKGAKARWAKKKAAAPKRSAKGKQ